MEKIVKRLFIGGTLLTALAVCGCMFSVHAYNGPWDNGICNDDTYQDTELCKDNNTTYSTDNGGTGVFHNKSVMIDPNTVNGTSTFSLTVNKAMVLSNVNGFSIPNTDVTNAINTSDINTGNITATVDSNTKYAVSLRAASAAATALTLNENTSVTPKISAITVTTGTVGAAVTFGTNTWGIKKRYTNGTYSNLYFGLTDANATFWESNSKNSAYVNQNNTGSQPITIPVGIGVSKTLPPGLYKTTVYLTLAEGTWQ